MSILGNRLDRLEAAASARDALLVWVLQVVVTEMCDAYCKGAICSD